MVRGKSEKNDNRFILELPLVITRQQEKTLEARLDVARQVYNGCLGEALRRLRLMRQSVEFRSARRLSKGKERAKAFKAVDGNDFPRKNGAGSRPRWI